MRTSAIKQLLTEAADRASDDAIKAWLKALSESKDGATGATTSAANDKPGPMLIAACGGDVRAAEKEQRRIRLRSRDDAERARRASDRQVDAPPPGGA